MAARVSSRFFRLNLLLRHHHHHHPHPLPATSSPPQAPPLLHQNPTPSHNPYSIPTDPQSSTTPNTHFSASFRPAPPDRSDPSPTSAPAPASSRPGAFGPTPSPSAASPDS
ncbi:hypothetical protein PHJA_000145900 [Phtheirospermum japonicum]|uniref:Uncharacterized protein n=1 Tax=Phtheirospermum japonicum TaxID=374723 RepID=A0A830B7A3_9LAMI|nr:hypothetical protein PHJA_000145900 [Phtheirospermum japonicum]